MTKVPHCKMLAGKTIQITGSKSETNRLLILQKLYGNIQLSNVSNSQDSSLLIKALQEEGEVVDIHHAGTSMRFLTSFYAVQPGKEVVLTGSERMKQRPIKPLVDALHQLDADIEYLGEEGFPPLKIKGKKITKNQVSIPANISSQFITSLLLVGARLENGLHVELIGKITSLPYLMMTIEILKKVGIQAELQGNKIHISPVEEIPTLHHTIESDWSSASYYYSLATIGKKEIKLNSFSPKSLQADARSVEIYQSFFGITTTELSSTEIQLSPIEGFVYPEKIEIDMNDCPDIAQTVCVTATALKIPFYITGLETLKVKETDRLTALQNELRKLGLETEITQNSIQSLHYIPMQEDITIATYNDHRMAMAFAPFALVKEIGFEDPSVVEKSYPDFWKDFYSVVNSTEIQ
nr:3-phosphoshikimate 1-carboxyvinyltransferase [Elizabethkingia sp. JS20170427COW]